jgi:hypothetical protein
MNAKALNQSHRALFNSGGALSGLLEQSEPAEVETRKPYTPKVIMPDERFQNVMHALGGLLKDRHVKINEARTCYAQLLDEWKEYQAWLNGEDVREVVDDPICPF